MMHTAIAMEPAGEAAREPVMVTVEAPEDRAIDPWRTPRAPRAKAMVANLTTQLENYEVHRGTRKKARRATDQQRFEALVLAIICDLAHRQLSEPGGRLYVSLSHRSTQGVPKRYRSPLATETLGKLLETMAAPELGLLVMEKGMRGHGLVEGKRTTIAPSGRFLARLGADGITLDDIGWLPRAETVILKGTKPDFGGNAVLID